MWLVSTLGDMEIYERRLTLFDVLRDMTISECTFGVLRRPFTEVVTALNTAERSCSRETTYVGVISLITFFTTLVLALIHMTPVIDGENIPETRL